MVRVLKAELSDRQMDKAIVIRLKTMPLNQNVEQGHRITESAFEVGPDPMGDFLEMTDGSQHRQHGFDQHAGIPFAPLAELEVGGMPVFLFKACIAEYDHVIRHTIDQVLESRPITDIGGVARPPDHQAQVVEQHTELTADNPAPVRLA